MKTGRGGGSRDSKWRKLCIVVIIKKIKKSGRETKPCMGKWGTTLMAWEMAWSLGSPLSPFSSANIFWITERKKGDLLWGEGAFCVVFPSETETVTFWCGMDEEQKKGLGLSFVQVNKVWHFVWAYLCPASPPTQHILT